MEKLFEKKNFGIPSTILCILAYLIGYLLTESLSGGLLVAVVFAAIVFAFQFDDKVKNAVKHAYIISALVHVIYLGFELFRHLISLVTPSGYGVSSVFNNSLDNLIDLYDLNIFQRILQYLYRYGLIIFEIGVVVIYLLLIIQAIRNKEAKVGLVASILGEAPPKPVYQQPMYQQQMNPGQPPMQPMYQQPPVAPVQAPVPPMAPVQAPMPPVAPVQAPPVAPTQPPVPPVNAAAACPNCGRVNPNGAAFCAGCGTKL